MHGQQYGGPCRHSHAVNPVVNKPANDDARCIEPFDPDKVGENRRLF